MTEVIAIEIVVLACLVSIGSACQMARSIGSVGEIHMHEYDVHAYANNADETERNHASHTTICAAHSHRVSPSSILSGSAATTRLFPNLTTFATGIKASFIAVKRTAGWETIRQPCIKLHTQTPGQLTPARISLTSERSCSVSFQPAAATFAWICSILVAPAITEATVGWTSSQAKASSRMV